VAHLIILDGYKSGTVLQVETLTTVGRIATADLRLTDALVSSRHATLKPLPDGGLEVADLSSTNGTFVNGERLSAPRQLELEDVVRFGETHLLFTDQDRPDSGTSTVHDSLVGNEQTAELPKVRWISDVEESVVLGDSGTSSERGLKLALPVVDAVQRSFSVAWDLEDLIRRIALGFVRATEASGVAVFVVRASEEDPELSLVARGHGEGLDTEGDPGFEIDVPLAHKAIRERGALLTNTNPDGDQTSVLTAADVLHSTVLCLALPSAAGVVGAVYLHGAATNLNRDDLRLLLLMANLAGVHVRSHLLLERVRHQADHLSTANKELSQAKQALATSNRALAGELDEAVLRGDLLSRIVQHVQDAVVSTNLEGVVTSWNHGAERLYGQEASEVVGQLLSTVPDELGGEFERILEAVSTGRSFDVRTARITSGGTQVPVLATYAPVSDEEGSVVGLVEIARDLRQRLREEERLRYEARVATFSELAATLAHEIGNPLANLRSGVEWLLARPREPQEQEDSLRTLHDEIDRLHRLARETLSLARWRAPEGRPISTGVLLDYAEQAALQRLEANSLDVEFERIDPPRALVVEGDLDQLKQALLNLVDNALDAMPKGGRLELEVEPEGEDVLLCVRDSGVGLTPEAKRRMFDPFFSTRPDGTGIGLAVVRRIAHLHGGSLEVESEPNRGTSIALRLPAWSDS
jgi:PAS domain S-box-containing protein